MNSGRACFRQRKGIWTHDWIGMRSSSVPEHSLTSFSTPKSQFLKQFERKREYSGGIKLYVGVYNSRGQLTVSDGCSRVFSWPLDLSKDRCWQCVQPWSLTNLSCDQMGEKKFNPRLWRMQRLTRMIQWSRRDKRTWNTRFSPDGTVSLSNLPLKL